VFPIYLAHGPFKSTHHGRRLLDLAESMGFREASPDEGGAMQSPWTPLG